MISKLENKIALRYLRTRKKDGFLNVVSTFSFIGISLGVAVLIIVMSVMNGFRSELIDRIVGFNAHAVVKSYNKSIELKPDKDFAKGILSNDGEAVIFYNNGTKGILLKGYLEDDFKELEISNNKKFFYTTLIGLAPWSFIFGSIGQGLDDIFINKTKLTFSLIAQPEYMLPLSIIALLIIFILN